MQFSKYAGCGNDFILVDLRDKNSQFSSEAIRQLCDRKNGIGADGLIALEWGEKAHYRMRIFNRDGSEAEMCGNGLRCFKKYLEELDIKDLSIKVETLSGIKTATSLGHEVKVDMGPPSEIRWDVDLGQGIKVDFLNTGVPHAVCFVPDIKDQELMINAPWIRRHPAFQPAGANVNFVQVKEGKVWVRTFERGVEAETLACGTGMTASGIAAAVRFKLSSPVVIVPLSLEEVKVEYTQVDHKILESSQTGPARFIFQGNFHYAPKSPQKSAC